jgi:hypothetical protein
MLSVIINRITTSLNRRKLRDACSRLVMRVRTSDVMHSILVICKIALHGSSAVEHAAVNRGVAGSIPARAATALEVKRIGKRLVLKTSARKGCRFESMPLPPQIRQRHPICSSRGILMGDRQAVRQPALNRSCVGSNPTLPESCLSSSSRRPRFVKPETRARIPLGTPPWRERSGVHHSLWRRRLMVRTSDFHPENAGSIPVDASNFSVFQA